MGRNPILSFLDWFEAVRYRWKFVAAVCSATILLGVVYVLLSPRIYQASSMLLVDSTAPDPLNEDRSDPGKSSRVVMATHADLIRTPAVALGAAQLSGLATSPAYIQDWQDTTRGRTPYSQWIADRMLQSIAIEPGKDTNVLMINARSSEPAVAARIANGFAQSALNTQYRLRTEPAKAYANWLETRLAAARVEVGEKQRRLSSFAQASGITDGDLSSEGSQMASVAGQLAEAEARAAAARQNTYTGAQSAADVERSDTVQQLRKSIAERSGKMAELQSTYGAKYPEVRRTQAELQELQAQLRSEVAKASSTYGAARAAEASAARAATGASEARLRAASNEQRARLRSMGTNLAQYSTLRNEFEAAQKSFNDINDRLLKMRLQGNVPETEVKIVNVASAPLLPSSPKVGFVLATAILLGLLLGALAAVILEALDPRVRSGRALERLLGVRVVGSLRLPHGNDGPRLLTAGSHL